MDQEKIKELAKLLAASFIERRDVKAIQTSHGAYMPVLDHIAGKHEDHSNCPRVPWSMGDVLDHLGGAATYGHYVVSAENTCRMFAFDIDLKQKGEWVNLEAGEWQPCNPREAWLTEPDDSPLKGDLRAQLFCMAAGLASSIRSALDIPCAVAYSGSKGLHVYGLLERGTPAADARQMALRVLKWVDCFEPTKGQNFFHHQTEYRALEVEVFPKQDTVREGDGLGNLIRLPLGINRKTGQRGYFIQLHVPGPLTGPFVEDDPLVALTQGSYRPAVKVAQ